MADQISHALGSQLLSALEQQGLTSDDAQRVLKEHPKIAAAAMVAAAKKACLLAEMLKEMGKGPGPSEGATTFDLARFRAGALLLLRQALSGLDRQPDFDPQPAVRRFDESIQKAETVDQWVRAAAVTLLDPIGTVLLQYYEAYSVSLSVGDVPGRRGYERIYGVIQEILRGVAHGLGKPEPVLPDLDLPCDAYPVEIAFGGKYGHIRVIRRGLDQDRSYIFWVLHPGQQNQDGKVIARANVLAW